MKSNFYNPLSNISCTQERKIRKSKIDFVSNGILTLGIEIELQLIDPITYALISRAQDLLEKSKHFKKIKPEFYLSTLEINTDKCNNIQEVEKDLQSSLKILIPMANKLGIALATTGSHPFTSYSDCIISFDQRYQNLIEKRQWVARRMTVYGLHVHLGMASGEECIRFNNFFLNFIPHLLALSASSPFWQGKSTGLASCRPTTYEAMPTAGCPYFFNQWEDFEKLIHTLKISGSINSIKDLWWDIRPSPEFGTLEIRVCDNPATLQETLAIVAFIHTLAYWYQELNKQDLHFDTPPYWMVRENKWRVMRYGLNAEILVDKYGSVIKINDDIKNWLTKLKPIANRLHYQSYFKNIESILELGTSSERQQRIFESTHSLVDVVKHNISEFIQQTPNW